MNISSDLVYAACVGVGCQRGSPPPPPTEQCDRFTDCTESHSRDHCIHLHGHGEGSYCKSRTFSSPE
jgi:hypothetical protein